MAAAGEAQGSGDASGAGGSPQYRSAVAAGLAAALAGAALASALDTARALSLSDERSGAFAFEVLAFISGLYAPVAVLAGIAAGVVFGAARATLGAGASRRALAALRDDARDRRATAWLIAGGAAACGLAAFTALASLALVAGVQRAQSGALLLGAVVAASLPLWAALSLPAYRIALRIVPGIPRPGSMPRAVAFALAEAALGSAAVATVVATRLDWRGLNWGPALAALAFGAGAGGWLLLWRAPLASLRAKIPRRGLFVSAAAMAAALLSLAPLRADREPSDPSVVAIGELTWGARVLVDIGRSLRDRDGDGYSPFFGGPDCDDENADVHPGATFVPGSGVDESCSGIMRELDALYARRADADADADAEADDTGDSELSFDGNVLVIAVDTLRADRLGAAGYRRDGRSLSPRMDAVAERGAYFTQAYAQAPNTPRSFPSIWTSKFPSQIAWDKQYKNFSTVLDENLLFWEVLREEGLTTTGFSSHFYFSEHRGIRQGFVEYDNEGAKDIAGSNKDIAAPRIVPKAVDRLEELAASGDRFAMFVHLFEPHSTYLEHDEFPITESGEPGLVQKYDYEIAYVDQWVGTLLDALDRHELKGDTMIVVLSDHGESFGDHRVAGKRIFFHGQTLYDDQLRVPLLIDVPGVDSVRHDDPVMLIDLAPTLLDILDIDIPERFVGRSLLSRITGNSLEEAPAYGELIPAPSWERAAKMMITGDGSTKLYHAISDGRFELYDLEADPDEQNDLARARPDELEALQAELSYWKDVELPAGATEAEAERESSP